MDTQQIIQLLNQLYRPMEETRSQLVSTLRAQGIPLSSGYYNGHYFQKDTAGSYVKDDYPIPVISAQGLWDMEIDFRGISISTKLSRAQALAYDYSRLAPYPFEAFGVADYLLELYTPGMSFDDLRSHIHASAETEIGFSFPLSPTADIEDILHLVALLSSEGFYY